MEETTIEKNAPKGLGWKIFSVLGKPDTQLFALVIAILLALQVLFGIFESTPSNIELTTLFFGKTVVVRLLGYLGLVNWAVGFYCRMFVHRGKAVRYTVKKRPWALLFAILLFWALLMIRFASDKRLAVFGSAYRYEGYLSYLAYAGIFLNASLIKDEKYRKILFSSVAVSSALLAGLTLIKELAGVSFIMNRYSLVYAYSATFINSNHYGYYLCVSMTVIAGAFMTVKKLWAKIALGLCFAVNTVVLLLNGSIGPYIAAAAGLLMLLVFFMIRRGFKKAWPIFFIIGAFILLSVVISGQKIINDIMGLGRITDDSFGSIRGVLWKKTVETILKHPITGVGTDNVQLYIGLSIPHNEYLQIAANLGFPGIILYLSALAAMLAAAMKNLKKLGDGALIAGTAAFVYGISAFVGISIPIATYQLFLYLGLLDGWFRARDDAALNAMALEAIRNRQEETKQ
ncbi:MAG: O-antigen ligase family protein [Clostridia bacterium]|nr:O-antigen ligase family protein [Clostridia bacterium]